MAVLLADLVCIKCRAAAARRSANRRPFPATNNAADHRASEGATRYA